MLICTKQGFCFAPKPKVIYPLSPLKAPIPMLLIALPEGAGLIGVASSDIVEVLTENKANSVEA